MSLLSSLSVAPRLAGAHAGLKPGATFWPFATPGPGHGPRCSAGILPAWDAARMAALRSGQLAESFLGFFHIGKREFAGFNQVRHDWLSTPAE